MSTPETNLRIFLRPSMQEIVFPDNSATFIDWILEPIGEGSQIVRDVNANLRDLSNPAFRKYALSLSCTDNRLPPLANLWAGQVVDVELPGTISERGSSPSRTAVAGSVVVSGSRVTYRPRLTMMIRKAPALTGVEFRGGASGWSIELEETNGGTDVPVSSDRLVLGPRAMEVSSVGTSLSVAYEPELTKIPDTQTVTWSVTLGALPPGLSLNPATGVVSGTPTAAGAYAFTLRASSSADVWSEQTYVFDLSDIALTATGGVYVTWTDAAGQTWGGVEFLDTDNMVLPRGGDINFGLCGSGAGGGRSTSTPGAGAGGGALPVFGQVYVPAGTYPVVIPAGGAEQTAGSACTWNGFSSQGGGRGGNPAQNGGAGGNGGGGGGRTTATDTSGGAGSAGGFSGGVGKGYTNTGIQIGGGGGGAAGIGGNGRGTILGSPGGPGLARRLHRLIILGGGGAGGASSTSGAGAEGIAAHGGNGGASGQNGQNAAANSGAGGGGAGGGASGTRVGGQGGSGWAMFWWEI